ncbi:MAG: hypothetical protein CMP91_07440 [Gammaproteobacteria bacterium]|nr:hypothetical protein [Gammaproteobacteria bacterium]
MSLRKAINAKCAECIYDPIGGKGGKKQQIEACTSYACPLYPVRPRSSKSAQKKQLYWVKK